MKKNFIIILLAFGALVSCSKEETTTTPIEDNTNKVLVLKVDYNSHVFEGGKELVFSATSPTMTISNEFIQPADFGSLKLIYSELDETIFDGTIVWNGLGQMNFPTNLLDESQFEHVVTADYVLPAAGFENVFNLDNTPYDYESVWIAVQGLVKVRQYLQSNPNATVKMFLYTPSVGIGNPEEWDWIVILKN